MSTTKYITETCEGYSLIDNTTGAIKELKIRRKITQQDFIMVFLQSTEEFMNLDGVLLKMLWILWRECSFNPEFSNDGNIVTNDLYLKNKIRNYGLNVTDTAINTYFARLSKYNILIKICKGRYKLNPKYFFKGRLSDASKITFMLESDNNESIKLKPNTNF